MHPNLHQRPSTPLTLPALPEPSNGACSESPSSPYFRPLCSYCTSPTFQGERCPVDNLPELELSRFTVLEQYFLDTLSVFSTTSVCVQATAIVPQDNRVSGHWPLIELLCHRVFATFPDQGRIRKTSTSCYGRLDPGDLLMVSAVLNMQKPLRRLEATVTRASDSAVVAIVTALHDVLPLGPINYAEPPGPEDFMGEYERLNTSFIPEHVQESL